MTRLLLLIAALSLSPSLWAAKGKAPPKQGHWVFLLHSDVPLPQGWPEALRRAAEGGAKARTWVEPPAASQDDLVLTLGCADWNARCAGKAAALIGANQAIVVDATTTATGVTLKAESIAQSGAITHKARTLDVAQNNDGLRIATAWLQKVVQGEQPTFVVITSDLPDTRVAIDGKDRGATPLTLIDSVEPGAHTVVFTREGRAPVTQKLDVVPGTVNKVFAALSSGPAMMSQPTVGERAPEPLPRAAPAAPGEGLPTAAIIGFGVGGVGVTGTVAGVAIGAFHLIKRDALLEGDGSRIKIGGVCQQGDDYVPLGNAGCTPVVPNPGAGEIALDQQQLTRIQRYTDGLAQIASTSFVIATAAGLVAVTGFAFAVASMPEQTE